MSLSPREAAGTRVLCRVCGSGFRPWRTSGVCPLCDLPSDRDPLRERLSPRASAAFDLTANTWRLALLVALWVVVIITLVIVWTLDATLSTDESTSGRRDGVAFVLHSSNPTKGFS